MEVNYLERGCELWGVGGRGGGGVVNQFGMKCLNEIG